MLTGSGADIAYQKLLAEAGIPAGGNVSYDGARLEQLGNGNYAGSELGYEERLTSGSNTAVAFGAPALISGLIKTYIGNGRPVVVELSLAEVYHSVSGTKMIVGFCADGVLASSRSKYGRFSSAVNTDGVPATVRKRLVIPDGVSVVFQGFIYGTAAGTNNFLGADYLDNYLSIVGQ